MSEVKALGDALFREWGKGGCIRVDEEALWAGLRAIDAVPHRGNARELLMEVLTHLEAQGLVTLPARDGDCWDRVLRPMFPRWVKLSLPKKEARPKAWQGRVWDERLRPVVDGRRTLTAAQELFLVRLDEVLKDGGFKDHQGKRSRSLSLTGNEKALDSLLKSEALRGLDRGVLQCTERPEPLCLARVGAGDHLLVVENAEPFYAAMDAAKAVNGGFGAVAYGDGKAVLDSIKSLRWLAPGVKVVRYVGDLDKTGMDILMRLGSLAPSQGLDLRPAMTLYREMFQAAAELGYPGGWPATTENRGCGTPEQALLEYLDEDLRVKVAALWQDDHRIPEEVLSVESFQRGLLADGCRD